MSYTRETLIAKVNWEGGIIDALDYGIKAEDIEDPTLAALWRAAETQYRALEPLVERIAQALGLE